MNNRLSMPTVSVHIASVRRYSGINLGILLPKESYGIKLKRYHGRYIYLERNSIDMSRVSSLHEAVYRCEPDRAEVALSSDALLARFRAADPTRNGAFLPWLLRTYAVGGYRLEDLSKAHDTLVTFARLRGLLPNTATIDGETRNPRKLGSHITLASLWKAVAPLVEVERLAEESRAGEKEDTDKERALSQSRVIHRSDRMVIAVPMTVEASCWWGQGTQWCTAARKNNAFDAYYKNAPLIVVCLRKIAELPARKLQLHVNSDRLQFMDENDAKVSPEIILERWQDLKALLCWAVSRNGDALKYIPEPLRTEALCLDAVGSNGMVLRYVPEPLRTEAMCLVAVGSNGMVLRHVPETLLTEAMYLAAVGSNGESIKHIPEPLRTEALYIAAVGQDGWVLRHIPKLLRTEVICSAAVTQNGRALAYVPEPLRTEAMYLAAVSSTGNTLRDVPEPIRTEAMYLAAANSSGNALRHVPEHLRTDAICLAAVSKYGLALEYVPELLRTEALCTAAVKQDGCALEYIPELLLTEALCMAAVKQEDGALAYVPEHLRTEALCLAAIGRYEHRFGLKAGKANEQKSHDSVLTDLEDYLYGLQLEH